MPCASSHGIPCRSGASLDELRDPRLWESQAVGLCLSIPGTSCRSDASLHAQASVELPGSLVWKAPRQAMPWAILHSGALWVPG